METIKVATIIMILGSILFIGLVVVSDPENWKTTEQKNCEQVGGVFISNTFKDECVIP